MKAKIQNIQSNTNSFENPQIDVEVNYTDNVFPGGERLFIFTLPYDEYIGLDETSLDKKITEQGIELKKVFEEHIAKNEATATKEVELQEFINKEITI